MNKGEIVLVDFPNTDLKGSKLRPALILAEKQEDILASFITSRTDNLDEEDILLKPDNSNHLRENSKLRLFRLATLEKKLVAGKIGAVTDDVIDQINEKLIRILKIYPKF